MHCKSQRYEHSYKLNARKLIRERAAPNFTRQTSISTNNERLYDSKNDEKKQKTRKAIHSLERQPLSQKSKIIK